MNNVEKISIIISIFNEEETIPELYERIKKTITSNFSNFDHKIIFVDDGSSDKSFEILKNLHAKDKKIKVIQFSRNFGQHIAYKAGINESNGDYTIIMDGDLQDSPEEIPKLFDIMKKGFNCVISIRDHRQDSFFKKFFSNLFFKIMKIFTNINMPANQSTLRIFDKKILKELQNINELYFFMAGILSWVGFKQTTCLVKHTLRKKGLSKYNFLNSTILAINAILNFSNKPLIYISILGLFISIISILYTFYIIYLKFFYQIGLTGWTSTIAIISFLSGIILFSTGIVGLYVGKLYQQTLNRPLYIINEKLDD